MTAAHRRRSWLVAAIAALTVSAGFVVPTGAAQAAPMQSENVAWAPGAHWSQAYIPEKDGTVLHADILRPAHLSASAKTPVILSVSPYFNHSGSGGVAGALDGFTYKPLPPAQPNDRFSDLVTQGDLMRKGYTYVMVDLRGFGGSTGCLDYDGPGEQADVRAAVEWAASQPWSTGAVGMYGKSYDGNTGIMGTALAPKGLRAVVAQEPMYDGYRYLYQNGVRYLNSLYMGIWYDQIASASGVPFGDDARYMKSSLYELQHPECLSRNASAQMADSDHNSSYWRERGFAEAAHDSPVPLFLTQGLIENNTWPDGLYETIAGRKAPTRAWLGMWDHVRGNETAADGRLAMGRPGWFAEVMRWYDRYLKGTDVASDPSIVVEDNTGSWRAQPSWPMQTSTQTVALPTGSYRDGVTAVGSYGTQASAISAPSGLDRNRGLWRVSAPVSRAVRISGAPQVSVRTTTAQAGAHLVVDLYDLPPSGQATRITRAASVLERGAATTTFRLLPNDWVLAPGHRLGIRIVNTNSELYLPSGSSATVTVTGGTLSLPIDAHRWPPTAGGRSVFLDDYLAGAGRYTLPAGTPTDQWVIK
ncbi:MULTISPECIES: CocE/NonD family hydrolase [Gordonia]|uniref:Putative hydrolase n=1 Tax=Gordonia sputi NBRC 100414 TaxID=1089453 RepID=H5TWA2_9ACTN|nr:MULTISPECIES: CocE/NonD family hydrolase [Gordonia]NKY93464.1 CocE/NonD family hydrolase [Gordonia sputi]OBA40002.1 hypothetical protein A5766_23420 [Gordonia sp. 852002-51296_SCH5728562-b]OBA70380.1 hypothetical protein A5777_13165 [Gordonia sp. 852002-10350_SCH5691597]OBC03598.1 hypothetical protein A5786_13885 [Gordonia sp. 852002-50816_SCH5313054-a]OBC09656.1 hypothetical protein A5785_04420 [Gordonia sp. 852002-50395_SCH5434458]